MNVTGAASHEAMNEDVAQTGTTQSKMTVKKESKRRSIDSARVYHET